MCCPAFPPGLKELFPQLEGVLLSDSIQLSSFLRNYLCWKVTFPEAMAPSRGSPHSMTSSILKSSTSFRTPFGVSWDRSRGDTQKGEGMMPRQVPEEASSATSWTMNSNLPNLGEQTSQKADGFRKRERTGALHQGRNRLVLPLSSCVVLGETLSLSEPQFSYLSSKYNIYLTR